MDSEGPRSSWRQQSLRGDHVQPRSGMVGGPVKGHLVVWGLQLCGAWGCVGRGVVWGVGLGVAERWVSPAISSA